MDPKQKQVCPSTGSQSPVIPLPNTNTNLQVNTHMCEYKNTQGNKQMKTLGDTNSAQIPAMQRSEKSQNKL